MKLTDSEQKIATYLAKTKFKTSRERGITNNKKGPQSNYETDLEGVGSEMAAAKILNLWPDLQIESINDHDLTLGNITIDVKATKYKNGKLIVGIHKKQKPCDYYMLMIGSFPEYTCAGFCKKEDILNNNTITDLGWGPLHALQQSSLKSLEEFLNETEARPK